MTADEVAALEKGEGGENGTPVISEPKKTSSGTKRKAGAANNETPIKRSKVAASESADEDDDDDGEEDINDLALTRTASRYPKR